MCAVGAALHLVRLLDAHSVSQNGPAVQESVVQVSDDGSPELDSIATLHIPECECPPIPRVSCQHMAF